MTKTLTEYLEQTAVNDAKIFHHLVVQADIAEKSYDLLEFAQHSRHITTTIDAHIIHRASDLGYTLAGEAASRLPRDFKDRYPQIPWPALREIRDILTHRGEKQLSNVQKAAARNAHLQLNRLSGSFVDDIFDLGEKEFGGPYEKEAYHLVQGLRWAIGLQGLIDGREGKIPVGPDDPMSRKASLITGSKDELVTLISMGSGRSVLLEIGDYLKASSLFAESLEGFTSAVPKNFRELRNDLAHYNDWHNGANGRPDMKDIVRTIRMVRDVDKMSRMLARNIPNEDLIFSESEIAALYHASLTRRIKPDALAYLDTVVEKATAMKPSNPRLEQAIIIASTKLLRDRPLAQAQEIIDFVIDHPTSIMARDDTGKLNAMDSYRADCPAPLQSLMRRFVEDVQQRCTRSHGASII